MLFALGEDKLRAMLPELCDGCRNAADPTAREGYAMLWVHLPAVYGAKFEPFLPDVLPLVLLGLADDMEPVRDASMRAAQAPIEPSHPHPHPNPHPQQEALRCALSRADGYTRSLVGAATAYSPCGTMGVLARNPNPNPDPDP